MHLVWWRMGSGAPCPGRQAGMSRAVVYVWGRAGACYHAVGRALARVPRAPHRRRCPCRRGREAWGARAALGFLDGVPGACWVAPVGAWTAQMPPLPAERGLPRRPLRNRMSWPMRGWPSQGHCARAPCGPLRSPAAWHDGGSPCRGGAPGRARRWSVAGCDGGRARERWACRRGRTPRQESGLAWHS